MTNGSLGSASPCINSGDPNYVSTSVDVAGDPRVIGGTPDMGAYEFQVPVSRISYAWLLRHSMAPYLGVDASDDDQDGAPNLYEWLTDTDPADASSRLRVYPTTKQLPPKICLLSSKNRIYTLEFAIRLDGDPDWSRIPGVGYVRGTGGVLSLTDTNGTGPRFYRVSIRFAQ